MKDKNYRSKKWVNKKKPADLFRGQVIQREENLFD